jgi:hypothetical protein
MDTQIYIQQLDELVIEFNSLRPKSQFNDLSDLPKNDRQSLITRSIAAVYRISSSSSQYSQDIRRILDKEPELHVHTSSIIGIVQALRDDIKAGYIQSLSELIHADIFADFLEMAQHLVDNGYKDASAVIAGSTLESHLRKLCNKNNLSIEEMQKDGSSRPLKADSMNTELAKNNIYSKLDQKNVTAWLDLRNKAAHGQYNQYTNDQVKILISGIRDYIVRNPA